MFARSLLSVVAALPLLASCGGGNVASVLAKPPAFEPKGQTKCGVTKSQTKPLIVEWPSSDRAALESLVKRGAVSVRYEGCEMEVLGQCRAPGSYRYSATTRKADRVTIKDADDLYMNVPLGAAKLEGKLEKAGELDVAMTIVGRFEAEQPNPKPEELDGPDCARATHVITAITVGAFDFFAGADAQVGAGATVNGVGAGAKSAAKRELLTSDGDADACKKATKADKEPPDGCGAFLRIEVVALKPAGAAPPSLPETALAPGVFRTAGLVWQAEGAGKSMTWAEAKTYCATLGLSGGGWRLPTKDELLALYESKHTSEIGGFWSSTPAGDLSALDVVFGIGAIVTYEVSHPSKVRCAR